VRQSGHRRHVTSLRSTRRVFWAAIWPAIVLIAIKAYRLHHQGTGPPRSHNGVDDPDASSLLGSQVDLASTIAELAGVPPAPDWQRRSLFDPTSSLCGKGSRNCSTSIQTRTSSTIWRRWSRRARPACASGLPHGPRRTAASTNGLPRPSAPSSSAE
jgi:hypothetical protein